jgi:hypothetical protein
MLLAAGRFLRCTTRQAMMMEAQTVSETLNIDSKLARLIFRDFSALT